MTSIHVGRGSAVFELGAQRKTEKIPEMTKNYPKVLKGPQKRLKLALRGLKYKKPKAKTGPKFQVRPKSTRRCPKIGPKRAKTVQKGQKAN